MKIETGRYHAMIPSEKTQKRSAERAKEEALTAKIAAPFSVTLSKALEQLSAPAGNEEEIRRSKVAAIREQLASGSYNISGRDVANKILNAIKE